MSSVMTSVSVDRFEGGGGRAARMLDVTSRAAADELAGRTIWSAAALPGGRASARELRTRLREPDEPTAPVRALEVGADASLIELAQRLERLLTDATAPGGQLGAAERDVYAQGAGSGEALGGDRVNPGDVVVIHDALAAALAEAARERGAHAVWFLPPGARPSEAWDFLRAYTAAMDAYLTAQENLLAALMPSADAVAAKELPAGAGYETVGWSCLLADVVHDDRHEHVGGARRARPAVTAR
jgi:hypothetical protein